MPDLHRLQPAFSETAEPAHLDPAIVASGQHHVLGGLLRRNGVVQAASGIDVDVGEIELVPAGGQRRPVDEPGGGAAPGARIAMPVSGAWSEAVCVGHLTVPRPPGDGRETTDG